MAKTQPVPAETNSDTPNPSSAVVAASASPASAAAEAGQETQGPTPENTPLPGGGSWRWDISKPGWVERDLHTGDDVPEPAAVDAASVAIPE